MLINENNWNYSFYSNSPLKAFISLGADSTLNEDGQETTEIFYFLTVSEGDHGEIFQSTYKELNEALKSLNEKYNHWEFKEASGKNDGDGCSTCAAH